MSNLTQDDLLDAANRKIKKCAFDIRQSLLNDDIMAALNHATEMVDQLRLNILSPKSYYNIYIQITDELRKIEAYLTDEFKRDQQINSLYEIVQYNQFVLPRLYMMITVGVVYLNANILPRCELLRDMNEMCRGIQHPMRGLFLRNYLLQAVKNSLTTSFDSPISDGQSDDISMNPLDFILMNFCEMNKLWVRLQYQGHSKEQAIREQERKELKLLVGTNILRLSQLTNLSLETYAEKILPFICVQLVSCRDSLAQEYIFECIIQAFPDFFHIHTFEKLMTTLMTLHATISVDTLLSSLTTRLAEFSHTEEGSKLFTESKMISKCTEYSENIIKNSACISRDEVIGLYKCVLKMALSANIETSEKLNTAVETAKSVEDYLSIANATKISGKSPLGAQLLNYLRLFVSPNNEKSIILELIQTPTFASIVQRMEHNGQSNVATTLLNSLNSERIKLNKAENIRLILKLLDPLMSYPWIVGSEQTILAEQQLLGTFPHYFELQMEPTSTEIQVFSEVMCKFETGGAKQLIYRLPSLVMALYKSIKSRRDVVDENYYERMLMEISYPSISSLLNDYVDISLNLLIQGAMIAGSLEFSQSESCAYEFITQAFALFEDAIVDSHKQVTALTLIFGAVQKMQCFTSSDKSGSNLRKRLIQASMSLLKRPDQSRMFVLSSNLHWGVRDKDSPEYIYDSAEAFACLQKARKIAAKCIDHVTEAQLFLDIIDQYIYFIEDSNAKNIMIDEKVFPTDVIKELFTTVSHLLHTTKHKDMSSYLSIRANQSLGYVKAIKQFKSHFSNFTQVF